MRNGTAKYRQPDRPVAANLDQRIRWDDLRIFLATCRAGTVSSVAQTLGIDSTTVSRKIERLEKSLKTKLFERRNTGYVPTRSGEKLWRTAERVESAIVQGETELADRDVSLTGIVRVGAPDGFGSFFLAPRLAGFCNAHPEVEVQLMATARVFSLSNREADIAIALALPAQGRVVGRKLTDYRLGLYASRAYVKTHPKIKRIDDLTDHLFISYIDEFLYTPLLDYVRIVSKTIAPRFKSANLIAQYQAAKAGQGIAILPCFMADQDKDLVALLRNEVKLERTFYLLLHEDNRNLARVKAAADFIVEEVRKNRKMFLPGK